MSDTLDFLRNKRNRTSVPVRDKSLMDSQVQVNDSPSTLSKSEYPDSNPILEPSQISVNHVQVIQSELDALPEIARRSNIRVEAKLLEQAEQDFKKAKITLETFFEAAYSIAAENPELYQRIVEEARSRKKVRDRAGQLRRDLARLSSY